ncbi:MAG: hypothetical protein M3Y30_00115 [Gemmatimonadota bacterium]|nr:hypothetical protein [Gemmatimonadota bacterium]
MRSHRHASRSGAMEKTVRRMAYRMASGAIVVAAMSACSMTRGIVRLRSESAKGSITTEEMQMAADTVVRNACPRIMGDGVKAEGTIALRVVEDINETDVSARVLKSSGDPHVDAALAELASQLPPRFTSVPIRLYNPRYDVAVHYTCLRDEYGVTGKASVDL